MRTLGRPPSDKSKTPTNERILMTAADLFLRNSYQEVAMDDVAEACNVTKATVYYYYKTKTELYTESMVMLMERIRGQINHFLAADKPLYDRLMDIAEAYLSVSAELDKERFMHSAKNALSNKQIESIQKAEESLYQGIEDAIREAVNKGEIRAHNPAFAVRGFVALLNIGHSGGKSIFHQEVPKAKEIVDFFWRSLEKK